MDFNLRVHWLSLCMFISSKYSAEILARSLANFCCSYGDRHIDLYFIRYGNEQESAQCENLLS